MRFTVACSVGLAASVLAWVAVGRATAATDGSPFVPGPSDVRATAAMSVPDLDALVLAGISTLGETHLFNLVDARTHRGFWLALDEVHDGIAIESFDAKTDSIVLRLGERTRTIALRRSVIAPDATAASAEKAAPVPAPATSPAAPSPAPDSHELANPRTPAAIAQAEMEARMLVSDLLEISMRERARQRELRQAAARRQPQNTSSPDVQ